MPARGYHMLILAPVLAVGLTTCRQLYAPPAITNPNRFLVVDGFIDLSPNSQFSLISPYYYDVSALVLASRVCVDFTLLGGTNIRPPFMPD